MTEQVLKVLGKLDQRNTRSIIWVTLEQAKLIIHLALLVKPLIFNMYMCFILYLYVIIQII